MNDKPTIVERLRYHSKNPVVGAIGDEYFHELFGRSADHIEADRNRIEALEHELAAYRQDGAEHISDVMEVAAGQAAMGHARKLQAKLKRVEPLPEKWRQGSDWARGTSTITREACATELEQALNAEKERVDG